MSVQKSFYLFDVRQVEKAKALIVYLQHGGRGDF